MITTEIIIIFLLLLLNAFLALSEMAVVSASKPLLRQYAKQGSKRAAAALALADDPGKFLSTVQVGITLVGILAGAYGGATIAEKLQVPFNAIAFINPHGETVAIILVVSLITYFSVILGELIPKQFALSHPEKLAMLVARPMHLFSSLAAPLVFIMEGSAAAIMRLFGILGSGGDKVTATEVKAVIAEGAASGALEHSEHQMLQRVIRLDDREVKSIMTHRVDVTFIDINDSPETIRAKVHDAGHSRYPVIDGDYNKIIGIVQTKELIDWAFLSQGTRLTDYLKEAPTLQENTSCLKALDWFKSSKIHLAVIIDEYGVTKGIVTASDILEAIVGILPSNYDQDEHALIFQREDGSWLVDGRTPIDEIHITIGLEEIAADSNYETIAGFMLNSLEKAPADGDVLRKFGHKFEVMDMDGRRIDKVLITKDQESSDMLGG